MSFLQGGYLDQFDIDKGANSVQGTSLHLSSTHQGLNPAAASNRVSEQLAAGALDNLHSGSASYGHAISDLTAPDGKKHRAIRYTDLDLLSLSNVPPGSPRMWVHLASVYVISILCLMVRCVSNAEKAAEELQLSSKQACDLCTMGMTHFVLRLLRLLGQLLMDCSMQDESPQAHAS